MIKKVIVFILTCIIIYLFGGYIITLVLYLFDTSEIKSAVEIQWFNILYFLKLYQFHINGTIFVIGFLLNFLANKFPLLSFLFSKVKTAESLRDSGFEYINIANLKNSLYKKANNKIIICAQNHHFIANDQHKLFIASVDELIHKNKKMQIQIFVNDPEFLESAITWEAVNFPRNFRKNNYKPLLNNGVDPIVDGKLINNNFYNQLVNAVKNLKNLENEYPDNIKIYSVPLMPISITFIDPDDKKGFLVLVPNFFNPKNTSRPFFTIWKKYNRDIFNNYYDKIKDITSDSISALSGASSLGVVKYYKNKNELKINKTVIKFINNEKNEIEKIILN